MIIRCENCRLEIGLIYERYPIESGPLKGFCEVRVWPEIKEGHQAPLRSPDGIAFYFQLDDRAHLVNIYPEFYLVVV